MMMIIYIYKTNSSVQAGCDTRLIFSKRSSKGSNSEFSFISRLVAILRLKSQSTLLFTRRWRENNWIHVFQWSLCNVKCKRVHSGFELRSPCPFPTTKYFLYIWIYENRTHYSYIYIYIYIYFFFFSIISFHYLPDDCCL